VTHIRAFAAFWYDFVIGDDWRVAAGVVIALAVTGAVATTAIATWWIVPVAVAILLPWSLWRAVHSQDR
jgi:tryptophan-rich sensory protein